jgi:hypothetical protein
VTRFRPGDEVFGWCHRSFAEYAAASEDGLALKPANLTFEQAAAVPIPGRGASARRRRSACGEKSDAGYGGRGYSPEALHRRLGNVGCRHLRGAQRSREHHVRLEDHGVKRLCGALGACRPTWCSALTRNNHYSCKRHQFPRLGPDPAAHSTGLWQLNAYIALTVLAAGEHVESGRYLTPRVQAMPDGVRRVRLMLDTADLPLVRSSSTSVTRTTLGWKRSRRGNG